jgi:S1-C subfamily serine protease
MASNTEISGQPSIDKVTVPDSNQSLQVIPVPPVVRVIEPKDGYSIRHGTGFFIDNDGHVATAAHVVEEEDGKVLPRLSIATERGDYYSAHVEKLDDINDIAILKVDAGTPKYIPPVHLLPQETLLHTNDPVRIWGFPESITVHAYIAPGFFWGNGSLSDLFTGTKERDACLDSAIKDYSAHVNSYERQDGLAELHRQLLVLSSFIEPGFSGGPVVAVGGKINNNDIGIQDLASGPVPLSWSVPVKYIKALMDDKNAKFMFTYEKDPMGWGSLITSVKRTDGTNRPPYHFQLYEFLRKKCDG